MSIYPPEHHPVFFLRDALLALGAEAQFNGRDDRTLGCWGLVVNGRPMVWLIDNRHPHEAAHEDPAAKRLLDLGALVCHAQRRDAERVGGHWLPLAVTPGFRLPDKPVEKLYDVAFVGYVRDPARAMLLTDVAARFRLFTGQGIFGEAAVSAYWQAHLGLNIPTNWGAPDSYDSANMRCFEILATGTPLVTPYEDYLNELGLIDRANCLIYVDPDHLINLLTVVLKDADQLKRIGENGAKLAQTRHTYEARAKQVLEWLK